MRRRDRIVPLDIVGPANMAVPGQQRVQVPRCETLTNWVFTDLDSWIDATFGPDDPLELDEQYRRKPAYYGIVDGFLEVPVDPPGTPPNMIANGSFDA